MPTFSKTAYEAIRNSLINGQRVPGERLSEVTLAEELGIKRGPVREALLQLAGEGFLERRDEGGCQVATVTPRNLLNMVQLRQAVEVAAARLAAVNADDIQILELDQQNEFIGRLYAGGHTNEIEECDNRFHWKLVDISNNPVLLDVWNRYHIRAVSAEKMLCLGFAIIPRSGTDICHAHGRILDAIRQRDPEAAGTAVRDHIYNSLCQIERQVRKAEDIENL